MTFTDTVNLMAEDGTEYQAVVYFQDGEYPRISEAFDIEAGVEVDPRDAKVQKALDLWIEEAAASAA